jgi:NADP-dependent 3-hydroxy acid dehydrogenase YdfG
LPTDVTDAGQARAAVDQTVADLGRLDIVVNNAGVMLLGPVDEAPLDEWERMVSLNLGGLLNITHAAIPHLLTAAGAAPRRVADLVNVSSVAGRVARANAAVYDLTKFGVGGFSESARQEFARRHLRIAAVEPGVVRTEVTDHIRATESGGRPGAPRQRRGPRIRRRRRRHRLHRHPAPPRGVERGGDSPDRAGLVGPLPDQDSVSIGAKFPVL